MRNVYEFDSVDSFLDDMMSGDIQESLKDIKISDFIHIGNNYFAANSLPELGNDGYYHMVLTNNSQVIHV